MGISQTVLHSMTELSYFWTVCIGPAPSDPAQESRDTDGALIG